MITEHEASRTLVKSPPELWAECSDASSLARHIGEFGEITITRADPETSVVWEGERANGTVRLEPSGWGTRVTLTVQTEQEPEPAEEEVDAEVEETVEEPAEAVEADAGAVRRRWKRLIGRWRSRAEEPEPAEPAEEEAPEPSEEPEVSTEPEPSAEEPDDTLDAQAILAAALDSLGQAHHRPFSRA